MKKFIALLLVAVMLLGLVACGGNGNTTGSTDNSTESTATDSTESTASDVTWVDPMTYLTESGLLTATSKHCYITEDVHLKLNSDFDVTAAFGGAKQIIVGKSDAPASVVIDLNGYTWSSNNRFYVEVGSTGTILDTSDAQTGKMTSTGSGTAGRVICNNGIFNLYSGTLTMTLENAPDTAKGGVVYNSKGTFNMYGGTITGGKVDADGKGGNLAFNAGTFNLYDGTITNGTATEGYNVYLEKDVTFNQEGGSIIGNAGDETNGVFQAS